MTITSLRLSDEAVVGRVHPHTGEPLSPLGFRRDGRAIFPILGAAEDDDNDKESDDGSPEDDDDDGSSDDDPEGDESSEDDDDSKESEDDKSKGDKDKYIKSLEERSDRLFRKRKEAETRANDLQKQLDDVKAKGGPETEQLTTELRDLKASNAKLVAELKESRIHNAFLSENTHEWQNPVAALKLTDLSQVEIDDDGSVHGVAEALAKTAKDHPYLLKSKTRTPPKKSGEPPKGKKGEQQTTKEKEAELKRKYRINR